MDNTSDGGGTVNDGSSPSPAYTGPVRVKAILDELDRAADEYVENHKRNQETQVHFTAARERFASVKRIAAEMLSFSDWFAWQERHGNVRFAAMSIGGAIQEALRERAFEAAGEIARARRAGDISLEEAMATFHPGMSQEQIVDALERGGFEFKGAPRRQIHAALLKLEGVNTVGEWYVIEDADEILQLFVHDKDDASEKADASEEEVVNQ